MLEYDVSRRLCNVKCMTSFAVFAFSTTPISVLFLVLVKKKVIVGDKMDQ